MMMQDQQTTATGAATIEIATLSIRLAPVRARRGSNGSPTVAGQRNSAPGSQQVGRSPSAAAVRDFATLARSVGQLAEAIIRPPHGGMHA